MQKPSEQLIDRFPFKATKGQEELFKLLDTFLGDKETPRQTLVLKGYAGTGKTSVLSALVKVLPQLDYKFVLLAPTGRAAKVMSVYSMRKAFTIHKIIFKASEDKKSGKLKFKRIKNKAKDTIYLVDEASMINNSSEFGKVGLLTSLIDFVFEEHFSGNKLILIGDTAQLPPVHQEISPALDTDHLQKDQDLEVTEHLLTEVVRQERQSGILFNATNLRDQIARQHVNINLKTKAFSDMYSMKGNKMEDGLRYAYDKFGVENTCIITRSNKAATMYNKFIRQQLHFRESELEAGDFLMIVKNNYEWLPLDSKAGFLANGEFVEVMRVNNFDEKYGLRFADLTLRLVDYPGHALFEAKVMLDTLHSFTPALTQEEFRSLQDQVLLEYLESDTKEEQMAMVRADEHMNALQVKFAYALTCHKSQGGQWNAVFVDQGYVNESMINVEWMRWLYTAMTRATEELFLVNFHDRFF